MDFHVRVQLSSPFACYIYYNVQLRTLSDHLFWKGLFTQFIIRSLRNLYFFFDIGYQNFINNLTKLVSSQTLAHVQLRVCLKY